MDEQSPLDSSSQLHRALNFKDLVLLNVACIFGFTTLAQVAQFGYSSVLLLVVAIITFLIPSGLAVAELNARMPEEGGFYLWTREAFGEFHGYIAAWTYWLSNIVWLPTVAMMIAVTSLYVFAGDALTLVDNAWYSAIVSLVVLWAAIVLNYFGMERAKWIQNIGGTAIWLCVILLAVTGGVFVANHGLGHSFTAEKLVPDFSDFSILPYFAVVVFCFGGLELAPVMAGEIEEPKRNIPRAIIVASVATSLLYIVGTVMLLAVLPEGEINIIEGAPQAFHEIAATIQVSWLGPLGAVLVTLGTLGLFGAWLSGIARIPFVIGLNHYFPDALARIHPKWGSPHISLLMQGVVISILLLSSLMGATITEAYLILLDMSIILYFIPFMYMFASMVVHMNRDTGGSGIITLFRKSKTAVWLVVVLGFGTTLVSTIISAVPTRDIENKVLFVTKVVGGTALLIGVGLVVFFIERRQRERACG